MPKTVPPAAGDPPRCHICAARTSCLIGRLPPAMQAHLDPLMLERNLRKGEVLQTEGEATGLLHAVKLGTVVISRSGPDGPSRPVAVVGRGHLLGLWGLLDGSTPVGAQTLSVARVCELPAAALRAALDTDESLCTQLRQPLLQAYANLADWARVMRQRGLSAQLMAALLLLAQEQGSRTVALPSQSDLAALLAASRESVARAMRRLEGSGQVRRIDRWHAEIHASPPPSLPRIRPRAVG